MEEWYFPATDQNLMESGWQIVKGKKGAIQQKVNRSVQYILNHLCDMTGIACM